MEITKKKICSTCKEGKELSDFYNQKRSKDGKQSRCCVCLNKANKKVRDNKHKKEKEVIALSDIEKFCPACNNNKSIDLFYKMTKSADGLFPKCKLCVDNRILLPPKESLVKDGFKVCSKCKENKSIDCYSKSAKEKTGIKSACKVCLGNDNKDYEKRTGNKKEYRLKNKEKQNAYNRNYYYTNKEQLIKYSVDYSRNNPEIRKRRHLNRLSKDSTYKVSINIRGLINRSFKKKNHAKNTKSAEILGCKFEEFRNHIESQFLSWMNWSNYGKSNGKYNERWQLDHIIPMCNARTEKEVYLLNHWSNFQPLCAKLNNEKLCNTYPVTNLELKISSEDFGEK